MLIHERVKPIWQGEACIVAASGPSLTQDVTDRCWDAWRCGHNVITVSDAYKLMRWADVLYSCDERWWNYHKPDFHGQRWSSHEKGINDKIVTAKKHGLNLVAGRSADGFSADPSRIHYGSNSGFQAINLAILFGAVRIVLVGFNMQDVGGKSHFFGDHPKPLRRGADYKRFLPHFKKAAKTLPAGVTIVNATPNTALTCFPRMTLDEALK